MLAQLGSDEPDLLTLVICLLVLVIGLLELAAAVWVGAGFVFGERRLFAEALILGDVTAVLLGLIRLAAWGHNPPDEKNLDKLLGTVGWIWLIEMIVAFAAWSRGWPARGGLLPCRPRTLPGLLLRYAAYNAIGYAVAGMLGLTVVLLVTSQLAYGFIGSRRALKRAARPRGIDEVWDAEL